MTQGSVTSASTRPPGSLMEAPDTHPQLEAQPRPNRSRSAWPSKDTRLTSGDARAAGNPVAERFWSKVNLNGTVSGYRPDLSPCWLWTGKPEVKGYGRFHVRVENGRPVRIMAHRFAYEEANGPIPEGLVLDHLCRTRLCVNPYHLEAVTQEENTRRGLAHELNKVNHQTAKTHCPRNHPYDEANTYIDSQGGRRCRACRRVDRCSPPYHRLDCAGCA